MNRYIHSVVEGAGDKAAVPLLLRRLFDQNEHYLWQPADPIVFGGLGNLLKPDNQDRDKLVNLGKRLEIGQRDRRCNALLVLFDLDNTQDCPWAVAADLANRFRACQLSFPVAIVFARREFEGWFLASLETIAPRVSGLPSDLVYPPERDYEAKRGAKEWLGKHMIRHVRRDYDPPQDQKEFTRHLDLGLAHARCRSFRRLVKAIDELVHASETGQRGFATPRLP